MGAIVIYKSKTGFTKQYAEWIAEELSADLIEGSDVSSGLMSKYETIIYGGGLYAVGINGVKMITKNLEHLKGKKVVVFATGVSPTREEALIEVRDKNFTTEQQKYIKFFYLRGGFDYSRLYSFDKVLMLLLKWKIKLKHKMKNNLTPDEKGMLAVYSNPANFTRKKDIVDLISYINSSSSY